MLSPDASPGPAHDGPMAAYHERIKCPEQLFWFYCLETFLNHETVSNRQHHPPVTSSFLSSSNTLEHDR